MNITTVDPKSVTVAIALLVALITGSRGLWEFRWSSKSRDDLYEKLIDGLTAELAETKHENASYKAMFEDKLLPALLDSTHLLNEIHESFEEEAIRAAVDRENRNRS